MTPENLLPRLRARLVGIDTPDALLVELLTGVMDAARAYTWRAELPDAMASLVVKWAVVAYNQQGLEGDTARTEGSIVRTLSALTADIAGELTAWRQGRVGWHAPE